MENSYQDEKVHKNVQKADSCMEKVGIYTRDEENNILKRESSKTGYTVKLHFTEENESKKIIEDVQKTLVRTYVRLLASKGEK